MVVYRCSVCTQYTHKPVKTPACQSNTCHKVNPAVGVYPISPMISNKGSFCLEDFVVWIHGKTFLPGGGTDDTRT